MQRTQELGLKTGQGESRTILLVEDEALIAMNEKRLLSSEGYHVLSAFSGESAVQMVRQGQPVDLILMDIDLGIGIDGTQAARLILEAHDIPIVFLSGHTEKEIVEKTEEITSYGYVVKDSNPTVLFASIKMAFRLHTAHIQLRQNETRYRRLVDGAPDIVYTFSSKRGGLYYSPRVEQVLGYPVEYLYSHPFLWNESIHPEDSSAISSTIIAFEHGQPFDVEYRIRNAQGNWIWLHDRSIGYLRDGDEVFIEGLAGDITERKKTEAALQTSEARFRLLFEKTSAGALQTAIDGQILNVNAAMAGMLGYTIEELRQHSFREFTHPDDINSNSEQLQKMIVGEQETAQFEKRYLHKNGSIVWANLYTTLVRDPQDKPLYFITNVFDITKSKQDEDRLRESEQQYRQMFNEHSAAKLLIDPANGAIVQANRAAAEFYGYPIDQLQTLRVMDLSLSTPEDILAELQSARPGKRPQNEYFHRMASGQVRSVEVFSTPIQVAGKNLLYSIIHDVTARRLAEQELAVHKGKLESILTGTHVGTWEWNIPTGETIFNERWAEMIGYRKVELEPITIDTWQKYCHPDDYKKADELLARHFNHELEYYECEVRMRHKNGDWVWVLDRGQVAKWADDGQPLLMFGTHTDITDRKHNEERIQTLLQEKELLLREVHHRIKNNMFIISSLLTIQADHLKEPGAQAVLQDATSRVQSMMVLYDKLYRSPDFSTVALKDYIPHLLREIVTLLPHKQEIRIETKIDSIILTPNRLSPLGIILNELTTNAVKYAFQGRTEGLISVTATKHDRTVCLTFADDGVGMPENMTMENSPGFGMQLIHIFAQQLRSTIRLEQNQGTQFILEFQVES